METTNRRYRVELTDGAKKDLKKLRQHRERIGEALGRLETNPLAGHILRGSLYNSAPWSSPSRAAVPFGPSMACSIRTPSASSSLSGHMKTSTTALSDGSRRSALLASSEREANHPADA
jgi:hypothetical protein